ncbi:MBL fold metallo-hydrolase [Nocardia harenae]|uniref:MBL fold metallo-hydrolase n=1 Tax=Nocardia harenae TaxID=358707 RepID=UPI00082AF3D7|nr:MBL fold metallo-hydrolase [Nocardia harenae]
MSVYRIDHVLDVEHPAPPGHLLEPPATAAPDWETAAPWFEDGWLMPMGGFLLRSADRTILVDAGFGPATDIFERSGEFMKSLDALGVPPEQITDIVVTHLHLDHLGWLAPTGDPVFPNARHVCHRADIDWILDHSGTGPEMAGVRDIVHRVSDLLVPAEGDRTEIADSVTMRLFAGHTPGNSIVEIDTPDGPLLLIGDTAHHPAALVEDGWGDLFDADHAGAARSRARLADEMERTGAVAIGAHFPGTGGGRITRDAGGDRRWVPVAV